MDAGSSSKAKSEINVTPLVDVCLVLLIIFMVITPIILQENTIYLPKVEVLDQVEPDPSDPGALVVKLNADATVALRKGEAEEDVSLDLLGTKLKVELDARKDKSVFLDASTIVAYAQVAAVVDVMSGAGAILAVVETDDNPDQESAAGAGAGAAPAAAPATGTP